MRANFKLCISNFKIDICRSLLSLITQEGGGRWDFGFAVSAIFRSVFGPKKTVLVFVAV